MYHHIRILLFLEDQEQIFQEVKNFNLNYSIKSLIDGAPAKNNALIPTNKNRLSIDLNELIDPKTSNLNLGN